MGKLVQFTRRRNATKSGSEAAPGEVVLFTGVRYERQEAAPPKPAGSASGGGKRRRG